MMLNKKLRTVNDHDLTMAEAKLLLNDRDFHRELWQDPEPFKLMVDSYIHLSVTNDDGDIFMLTPKISFLKRMDGLILAITIK